MFQKLRARIAVAVFLLVASVVSRAAFHFMEISEVYSNASGTVQFIELNMLGAGQNQLFGRTISSTQGSNTNSFTFPNPNPGNAVAGAKILIGTVGYAALPGVPPPDYIIPNGFVFTSNVTINFAGAAFLTAPSIPTDGTLSIDRNGVTSTNSPTNNAGVSGTVVLAAQNTPPAAPNIISASGSDSTATIIFSAGSTGGSPILDFTATCTFTSLPTQMGSTTASPVVITGLVNGNTYACTITARNAVGNSPASSPINVTPGSAPGAPTNVTGSAGNGSATLGFTAPQNTGGAPILNYTVNCGNAQSGTAQSSGPTSPITVSGLINGTTYSCTVAANNSVGTGPPSTAVNVTPALPGTVPDAPTITSAVPGNAQATISFTTPADGGNAITSYGVNCNSGQATASGASSPITVTGLSNGTAYSCSVVAINGIGQGSASAPASVTPRTVPGAPTIGGATAGNGAASIAFTQPASDGGSAITGFTATCNPGAVIVSGAVSPINVTGLTNGIAYTCSVTATNVVGNGAASAGVNVIPATVPNAPTIGAPIAGDGRAAVTFTAPASTGGSAIISFTATCGGFSTTGLASPLTVTGLTNGVAVTCSVIATNAVGNSAASATASVTPSNAAPLTPTSVLSRKIHGGVGTFDLPMDTAPAAVTAEPRTIGAGHTIVFQFNQMITTTGTVTVTPVGSASAVVSGFDVVVTLTGVPDNQRVSMSLGDVNGVGVNVTAIIGFLVGDVNNTRSVNSSDISGVKARSGQTTTGLNFRFDVNASGAINSSDISAVKARSGLVLP